MTPFRLQEEVYFHPVISCFTASSRVWTMALQLFFALIRYWLYRLSRFGVPVFFVGLAFLARWLSEPVLHGRLQHSFFYIAIVLTACIAGVWEAVAAVVLGWLVSEWFFVEPQSSLVTTGAGGWMGDVLYFFTGLAIVWFMRSERAARGRALTSAVEARKWREDLEAEKARHQEAYATQELLAHIVETWQDAIFSLTTEGRVMTWNAATEKLLGYSGKEAAGQPLAFIVPPEERSKAEQMLGTVQRGEPGQQWQTTLNRKDGSRVEVSLTASAARDAEGKVIGVSLVARPRSSAS
jgi:PAS domain S-box-containing protein